MNHQLPEIVIQYSEKWDNPMQHLSQICHIWAALRPETELVAVDKADISVFFMHSEGLSIICGDATIALGRSWLMRVKQSSHADVNQGITARLVQPVLNCMYHAVLSRLRWPLS